MSKVYPNLLINNRGHYMQYFATSCIILGCNIYFDNETILNQFERLFQLLPFRTEYKEHKFGMIVDNARTHSEKKFSLNDFGEKIGTRYPVYIQYNLLVMMDRLKDYLVSSLAMNIVETRSLFLLAKELNWGAMIKLNLKNFAEF